MAAVELREVVTEEKLAENAKKDPLEQAKKVFRITSRKSDKNDKLRLEVVFDVEYDDPEDEGRTKIGVFRARRLNIGLTSTWRVLEARLNSGQELDADIRVLHARIAYLQTAIVEFPDWWSPVGFFDEIPVVVAFDYLRQWESSFRRVGVGG